MPTIHFHDLPIYRLTETAYDEELRELTHKVISDPPGTLFPTTNDPSARARASLPSHYKRHFGRWRFNEVVGYVRLLMVRRHVQGTYFGRRVRETGPRHDAPIAREVRTRTKVFLSARPLTAPLPIPPGTTNGQCLASSANTSVPVARHCRDGTSIRNGSARLALSLTGAPWRTPQTYDVPGA